MLRTAEDSRQNPIMHAFWRAMKNTDSELVQEVQNILNVLEWSAMCLALFYLGKNWQLGNSICLPG